MSAALDPLPGDPGALAAAAERLGQVAAGLRAERAAYDDGARTATLAVWRSDSALRISALHDGLRGIAAEYARVERSGTHAAGLLAEHARAWRRVEDELDGLRAAVRHSEAYDADRARRAREDAEERARVLKRALLEHRAALAAEVRALVSGYDPGWTDVPAAAIRHATLDSPMTVVAERMAVGTMRVDDAWAALADAHAEVADDDSRAWRSSGTYQVLGGLDELQRLLVGSVTDTGEAIAHPLDTLEGLGRLVWAQQTDPVGTDLALLHSVADPVVSEWEGGEQGRAVGRALAAAIEVAVGGKGLTKGLAAGREGAGLERLATRAAAVREAREAARLRRLGDRLPGSWTWSFASEVDAARAMAHPVPGSTYRVRHEGLATDYVFGAGGELVVVRGSGALLRRDVPVPPPDAFAAWHHISRHRGSPPRHFKGNQVYRNEPAEKGEARFPAFDADGNPISYRKYDIEPKRPRVGRPPARLLRGSDGSLWFSDDHYKTAVRIR